MQGQCPHRYVPDCAGGVDARSANRGGVGLAPIEGRQRRAVLCVGILRPDKTR